MVFIIGVHYASTKVIDVRTNAHRRHRSLYLYLLSGDATSRFIDFCLWSILLVSISLRMKANNCMHITDNSSKSTHETWCKGWSNNSRNTFFIVCIICLTGWVRFPLWLPRWNSRSTAARSNKKIIKKMELICDDFESNRKGSSFH